MSSIETEKKLSLYFFAGFFLITAFAFYTPGGPEQGIHGLLFLALGSLIIAFPPRYKIPKWLFFGGLTSVILCSLSLMPNWFVGSQDWRIQLEKVGLDTGTLITPHPEQTIQSILTYAAVIISTISLFGHRLDRKYLVGCINCFCVTITLYALISLLIIKFSWDLGWDTDPNFGLFPNGNHSVTLITMGIISGLGILVHYLYQRRWVFSILIGLCITVMAWSVLGLSSSKAGILLIFIGIILWFAGLGKRYRSYKLTISLIVLAGLMSFLYFSSNAKSNHRIQEFLYPKDELMGPNNDVSASTSIDKRLAFYNDAIAMIIDGPWTGTGLGTFEYIFPHYRDKSISNGYALHPESNCLDLAAEAGVVTIILLLGIIIWLFIYALKRNNKSRYRNLCVAAICAAAILLFHSLIDVPAQRVGILFSALFLIAITIRPPRKNQKKQLSSQTSRRVFMICGSMIVLLSLPLISAEWLGGRPTPLFDAKIKKDEAKNLYDESKKVANFNDSKNRLKILDQGIKLVEKAIIKTPLDPSLYYVYGGLLMQLEGTDDIIKRTYAIQRILDPVWSSLPIIQANTWLFTDTDQTIILWNEALRRAERLEQTSNMFIRHKASLWEEILKIAKTNPILMRNVYKIVINNENLIRQWMFVTGKVNLGKKMPEILSNPDLSTKTKGMLKEYWNDLSKRQ